MTLLAREVIWNYLREINQFENRIFGEPFSSGLVEFAHWTASRCFLYQIYGDVVKKGLRIHGLGSFVIVSTEDRDALIDGLLCESELRPWTPKSSGDPVVYFSSLYSSFIGGSHLLVLALIRELNQLVGLPQCRSVFAIGATAKGIIYLQTHGFVNSGMCYLGSYPIYRIDNDAWISHLLTRRPHHLREVVRCSREDMAA